MFRDVRDRFQILAAINEKIKTNSALSPGLEEALCIIHRLAPPDPRPVNLILFCPRCNFQHIDKPKGDWTNPPHKSHECQRCKAIWRPSNHPTNGVRSGEVPKGEADTHDAHGFAFDTTSPQPAPLDKESNG